jgi:hypothetical protein
LPAHALVGRDLATLWVVEGNAAHDVELVHVDHIEDIRELAREAIEKRASETLAAGSIPQREDST